MRPKAGGLQLTANSRFLSPFGMTIFYSRFLTLLGMTISRVIARPDRLIARSRDDPIASVQFKVPDRLACVGRFFRFFQSFLELLFEQVGGVLLGLDGLPEDRLAAAVLFLHGSRRFFHVLKCFGLHR